MVVGASRGGRGAAATGRVRGGKKRKGSGGAGQSHGRGRMHKGGEESRGGTADPRERMEGRTRFFLLFILFSSRDIYFVMDLIILI
jgi:hypothetical protein